jgi:hypothetical protein
MMIQEGRRLMLIAIKVVNCTDGDAIINQTAPRKFLRAVGLMPGGQLLIESQITEGHDLATQSAAIKQITTWLRANRPAWNSHSNNLCLQRS